MKEKILLNVDKKTGIVLGKAIISQVAEEGVEEFEEFDAVQDTSQIDSVKRSIEEDEETEVVSGLEVDMMMESKSYLDGGAPTVCVPVKESDAPPILDKREMMTPSFQDELAIKFCYFEDRGLVIRPYFFIEIENEEDILKNKAGEVVVFPIGTKVKLRVVYNDPDGVGFIDQIDHLKIKDSYDFVDIGNPVPKLNKKTKIHRFSIISDFPGTCRIRVKDDKHLCVVDRLNITFRQARK